VARRAQQSRAEVRLAHGLPENAKLVLLSFGGFQAAIPALDRLASWQDYVFVMTPDLVPGSLPPNVRALPRDQLDYVSLMAACDVVVTKPGYGIISDALANRVPVLYTDRGPFREYDVLAAELDRLSPSRYIGSGAVQAGELGPDLDALLAQPQRWVDIATNGATVAAERLLAVRPRAGAPA
jgi:L-arabinokinase